MTTTISGLASKYYRDAKDFGAPISWSQAMKAAWRLYKPANEPKYVARRGNIRFYSDQFGCGMFVGHNGSTKEIIPVTQRFRDRSEFEIAIMTMTPESFTGMDEE